MASVEFLPDWLSSDVHLEGGYGAWLSMDWLLRDSFWHVRKFLAIWACLWSDFTRCCWEKIHCKLQWPLMYLVHILLHIKLFFLLFSVHNKTVRCSRSDWAPLRGRSTDPYSEGVKVPDCGHAGKIIKNHCVRLGMTVAFKWLWRRGKWFCQSTLHVSLWICDSSAGGSISQNEHSPASLCLRQLRLLHWIKTRSMISHFLKALPSVGLLGQQRFSACWTMVVYSSTGFQFVLFWTSFPVSHSPFVFHQGFFPICGWNV